MKREFRLTRSQDFKWVRRNGKTFAHPLLVLIAAKGSADGVRVGIIASRAVGNAVHRNRAKRRLRAAIQPFLTQIHPAYDVILIARKATVSAPFSALQQAVQELLSRAGLL